MVVLFGKSVGPGEDEVECAPPPHGGLDGYGHEPSSPQNYLFGCELKADKDCHFKVDNYENEHQFSLRMVPRKKVKLDEDDEDDDEDDEDDEEDDDDDDFDDEETEEKFQ
ncbi:hypothetical protein STEG23_015754 [Scotinomys teguina]